MQFAAVSFLLPDGSVYAAYRGTDMTIVGWQEDFNMSFLSAVPCPAEGHGVRRGRGPACPGGSLRIGGHSKGGNLAAWAAVHLDEKLQRQRLIAAYNNDGPGFSRDLVNEPCYQAVADRLFTYIPASSIVGVLLEHAEDYEVVDSTARSIMQHEPLSWCVERPPVRPPGPALPAGPAVRRSAAGVDRLHDAPRSGSSSPGRFSTFPQPGRPDQDPGGAAQRRTGRRSGPAAEYAGADEEKKKIISEIFRRLAVDVKGRADEGRRSRGAPGGETILATGQAIADLRK